MTQRQIELGIKDYAAFSLFEGNERETFMRENDTLEFYDSVAGILERGIGLLNEQGFLDLLALKQNPDKTTARIIQEIEAPNYLIKQYEREIREGERKVIDLKLEIGDTQKKS